MVPEEPDVSPEVRRPLEELRTPLREARRVLTESMPLEQRAHSLHYELLRDTRVALEPNMVAFTHLELWELHTNIALAGLIGRFLQGEHTVLVVQSIAEQMALLAELVPRATQAWQMFTRSPAAQLSPPEVERLNRTLDELSGGVQHLMNIGSTVIPLVQRITGMPVRIPPGILAYVTPRTSR